MYKIQFYKLYKGFYLKYLENCYQCFKNITYFDHVQISLLTLHSHQNFVFFPHFWVCGLPLENGQLIRGQISLEKTGLSSPRHKNCRHLFRWGEILWPPPLSKLEIDLARARTGFVYGVHMQLPAASKITQVYSFLQLSTLLVLTPSLPPHI